MIQTDPPIPTVEEVKQIENIADPVIRNLRITQCYHELALALARRTGPAANWCTFATWASKQAGQTIRKEDLARLLESRLRRSQPSLQASQTILAEAGIRDGSQLAGAQDETLSAQDVALNAQAVSLNAQNFMSAIDRASEAVARGNKKVFEEIGYEFAHFYAGGFLDDTPDPEAINRFCADLRPGDPPEGQGYLRRAFAHYAQALLEKDAKARAEFILLANLEIGFHEQTRLQPEIAESLDAGLVSFLAYSRAVLGSLYPKSSWPRLANLYLRRWLGRPTALDLAIQAIVAEAREQLRQLVTDVMMTIALPSGVRLRLGSDLAVDYPESLKHIVSVELAGFLREHDRTPDSLSGSGALDWANLPDRLNFIIDFFRCYQEDENLFEPPFKTEQVGAMKAGRRPGGSL
jgi:hypothetical protein